MSTTAVHFLKITGKLAAETLERFEAIRLRCPNENNSMGSHLWHARDRKLIDHLGLALLSTARSLPVVWYSHYVDGYFMGCAACSRFGWPDGIRRSINSQNTGISYYPATIQQEMLKTIKRSRRPTVFDRHLRMAIEEFAWADGEPLVMAIAICLGGSLLDRDVHAAGETSLKPFLDATRDQVPPQSHGRAIEGFQRRIKSFVKKFREERER